MKITFSNILNFVLVGVVILLLLQQGCHKCPKPCTEQTVKEETKVTPHEVKGKDTSKPTLAKTEKPTKPLPPTVPEPVIITVPDTVGKATLLHIIDSLQKYGNEIYALYTNQNEYWDGIDIKDSTGKSYGFLYLRDTLAANQIVGRGFNYQLNFADTTRTITTEKKRTQIYIGGELGGNKKDIFSLAGLGLLLKTKKDNLYGVKATLDLNGKVYYSLQYYKLISFRIK